MTNAFTKLEQELTVFSKEIVKEGFLAPKIKLDHSMANRKDRLENRVIYVKKENDFLTISHEWGHVVHNALIVRGPSAHLKINQLIDFLKKTPIYIELETSNFNDATGNTLRNYFLSTPELWANAFAECFAFSALDDYIKGVLRSCLSEELEYEPLRGDPLVFATNGYWPATQFESEKIFSKMKNVLAIA